MKNKMNGILMVCFLMAFSFVAAASVDNVEVDYNKKENIAFTNYDVTLQNECSLIDISIYDHKDNLVSRTKSRGWCAWCMGNTCHYFKSTGTFSRISKNYMIPKNEIKGLGNLRYEIRSIWYGGELLDEGRLK